MEIEALISDLDNLLITKLTKCDKTIILTYPVYLFLALEKTFHILVYLI